MKKINIIVIALTATVGLGLTGCDDGDFLKEKPETFYTTNNVYSQSAQVNQVLASCYYETRELRFPDFWSQYDWFPYIFGTGTDMYDVATIRYSERFNDYSILSSQSDAYNAVYSEYYKMISIANQALEAMNKEGITWASEDDKNYAEAQGRFFRAYAYRNLGELYGGVPLVTETATTPRYDYQRSTRMATYEYAIGEMEAILNNVPEDAEAGKINRATVQHNLALLYIDKGVVEQSNGDTGTASFNMAVKYASFIIDGSKYKLMTERFGSRKNEDPMFYYANDVNLQTAEHTYESAGYPIKGNVYWDLFQEGNQDYQDGNTEAIWVAQNDYKLYKTGKSTLTSTELSLYYPYFYGPVFRDQGSAYLSGTLEDVGGIGICEAMPTFYTRDSIYSGKWGEDLRNSDAVFRRTFLGNIPGSAYYGKKVPWDVLYMRDANGKLTDDSKATELYPISCKIGPDKYTGLNEGEDRTRIFRDEYLIRLPETILLRAEAYWRLGDNDLAAKDINKLRLRAQCKYMVTASDVNVDLMLDERARELVYEEQRWNTLLRMGGTVATDRIKKYAYWDFARTSLANKKFNLWPIPQTVIDTNKDNKLEQNPGW